MHSNVNHIRLAYDWASCRVTIQTLSVLRSPDGRTLNPTDPFRPSYALPLDGTYTLEFPSHFFGVGNYTFRLLDGHGQRWELSLGVQADGADDR